LITDHHLTSRARSASIGPERQSDFPWFRVVLFFDCGLWARPPFSLLFVLFDLGP
jgi:hypothetical protein